MARLRVLRASLLALTLTFWSRAWVASRRGVVHGMLALPLPVAG